MPGYGIGSDTTLSITSNGATLASQILTKFNARQEASKLKSVGIDGVNRHRYLEEGWTGELDWDRADSGIDDYFAAKEAGRYAGQQPPEVSIFETTTAPDGSVAQYKYIGVTMMLTDIGERSGDKKIETKVAWSASRRIKVS